MAIIPFLQRLIRRPDPMDRLLQSTHPLFPRYIGTNRAHAAQTLYLVGSSLGMARTYQDSAEHIFEGEIQRLRKHLQDAEGSGAYELARWALELDDEDTAAGINRCVQPSRLQERRTLILEAMNMDLSPQPSPISK